MSNLIEIPEFPLEQLASWQNIAIVSADLCEAKALMNELTRYFSSSEDSKICDSDQEKNRYKAIANLIDEERYQSEISSSIVTFSDKYAYFPEYKLALESSLGTVTLCKSISALSLNIWDTCPYPFDLFFINDITQAKGIWYHFLRRHFSIEFCLELINHCLSSSKENWIVIQFIDVQTVNIFKFNISSIATIVEDLVIVDKTETAEAKTNWLSYLKLW